VTDMKNVAASVRQKLLNLAKAQRTDFQRMLTRYAIERFLCRLSQHQDCDRFYLKGATLFLTWSDRTFRPTGDLDLLGFGSSDPEAMKGLLAEIFTIDDAGDGMRFVPESLRRCAKTEPTRDSA
jgi:hypothetical protein